MDEEAEKTGSKRTGRGAAVILKPVKNISILVRMPV